MVDDVDLARHEDRSPQGGDADLSCLARRLPGKSETSGMTSQRRWVPPQGARPPAGMTWCTQIDRQGYYRGSSFQINIGRAAS